MTKISPEPEMRDDIFVYATPDLRDIANYVGRTVIENGVAVVRGFVTATASRKARAATRNLLIPTTPIRAARVAAEKILGREYTPDFLQRRPIKLAEHHWRFLGSRTAKILLEIQDFNALLGETDSIREQYGTDLPPLNTAILNRFAPYEDFERHQDSTISVGLSEVLQTSPTLWRVHEGGPHGGNKPFSFMTEAGDLIIQRQRSGTLDVTKLPRYTGFTEFLEDGSVVHSGLNLTARNRYTIALFSEQALTEQQLAEYQNLER